MRTTLDIDDDVLALARARTKPGMSIGKVISELARAALQRPAASPTSRNGLPVMSTAPDARPVTLDLVNQLRDDLPQ